MPRSLRNRGGGAHARDDDTDSDPDVTFPMNGHLQHLPSQDPDDEDDDGLIGDEPSSNEEEEEEEEEPTQPSSLPALDPPPPYLRDISTLASWSVSSSKPGCSIPQLRHPSTNLFWQSDGPQPHYLNIHFFKQVKIVGLRMYLDFEQDESYTPTRIVFLAGTGGNDLVEWGEWRGEGPRGWVWVGFGGVDDDGGDDEEDDSPRPPALPLEIESAGAGAGAGPARRDDGSENTPQQQHFATPQMNHHHNTPSLPHTTPSTNTIPRPSPRRPFTSLLPPTPNNPPAPRTPHMPVLRAHLVQIKILENHQNGKDTHLRGLQIFARNDEVPGRSTGARDMNGDNGGGGGGGRKRGGGGKGVYDLELDSGELGGLESRGGGIR